MASKGKTDCRLLRAVAVTATLILVFSFPQIVLSQSKSDTDLLKRYASYTSLSRELVYLHLNKTDFLPGEQLGFKAYVLDKYSKQPSLKTTNLYVQLLDENNSVFQEKLLQVKQGITHGTFIIDSTLTDDSYIVKAFTNWSRNFEEPNIHAQRIRILDFNEENKETNEPSESKLTVSFMPEGGHFIANTLNSLGIRITDSQGLGVPNLQVNLLKDENEVLKTITTNEKGLSKVLVNHDEQSRYRLSVTFQGEEQIFDLPKAEEKGFGLILANRKQSLLFNLNTNEITLPALRENDYKLAIHNGAEIKIIRLPKFDSVSIASNIPKKNLLEGLNIFTVLDQNNTPLLERLYYSEKTNVKRLKGYTSKLENDSLSIELQYDSTISQGSLSISVLPTPSIADNAHESIVSFTELAHHLSQPIVGAVDYFHSEVFSEKALDLELLIQGWSAYDWSNILYFSPEPAYEFEKGIKAKIRNKKQKLKNWYVIPNQGIELKRLKPLDSYSIFYLDSLFPHGNEKLKVSDINKNGRFYEPDLNSSSIEFFPNRIPSTNGVFKIYGLQDNGLMVTLPQTTFQFKLPMDKNTIALEEVVVTEEKIEDERLRNLKAFSFGEVTVFNNQLRKKWFDVITFLNFQPMIRAVNNGPGRISITNILTGSLPIVYLDGALLQGPMLNAGSTNAVSNNSSINTNLMLLEGLRTEDIDYIEVNPTGLGEGSNGAGGVIRIFTRGYYLNEPKNPYEYKEYEYPITFSKPDLFNVPVYSSYENTTYLKYGVLGWFPNLSFDGTNTIKVKVAKTDLSSIKLNIQGFSNNGDLFSEERIISLE